MDFYARHCEIEFLILVAKSTLAAPAVTPATYKDPISKN